MKKTFNTLVFLLLALSLGACSTLQRLPAVPKADLPKAHPVNLNSVRYLTSSEEGLQQMVLDLLDAQKTVGSPRRESIPSFLSISGGGDKGAFGAGLLNGWTEHGDRPNFVLVTGVSTGALIAPFAFLGSAYDEELKKVYTEPSPKDIFVARGVYSALFKDSYADTTPLYNLISKYITPEFLSKVAYEYQTKRRWLLIGTTNIDSGVPVIWNMGKIASFQSSEALELFRKILLASASIPGAFPPIMLDMELNGKRYQEMHVDGGTSAQVFLYPSSLKKLAQEQGYKSINNAQAYIIRNARLETDWSDTERRVIPIVTRSISNLIQTQGQGDLLKIYETTQRDKVGYNLAFIGSDFTVPHLGEFEPEFMSALFNYGFERGKAGYPWGHQPPGFENALEKDVEIHSEKVIVKINPEILLVKDVKKRKKPQQPPVKELPK